MGVIIGGLCQQVVLRRECGHCLLCLVEGLFERGGKCRLHIHAGTQVCRILWVALNGEHAATCRSICSGIVDKDMVHTAKPMLGSQGKYTAGQLL